MAARKTTALAITPETVLSQIFADGSTPDDPSQLTELAMFLGTDAGSILKAIEDVSSEFLGDDRKGGLWLTQQDSYFDTDDMLSNYRATHAPQPAPAKPVRKAAQPVKDKEGKNVTVPVDFDNPENGRRELDAAQGERVIGEDTLSALVAGIKGVDSASQIPVGSSQNNDKGETVSNAIGWTNTEHLSKLTPEHESNQFMEPTEDIPAPPEGVNANMWELAYTAPTRGARVFWFGKCKAAAQAWKDGAAEREAAAQAEAERIERERQQDDALGVPMPF